MNLIDTLSFLGSDVKSNLHYINEGGCCVYAGMLGRRLAEKGINAVGRVANYSGDLNMIRKNAARSNNQLRRVNDWESQGITFWHVFLQFAIDGINYFHDTDNTIDSRGVTAFGGSNVVPGELTLRELRLLAGDRHGWNSAFDRREGIPVVRRIIDQYLPPEGFIARFWR